MSCHHTRRIAIVFLLSALLVSFSSAPAWTQEHPEPAPPKASPPTAGSQSDSLPPLPKDASVSQSVTVNGQLLHYTATVGTIQVYNRTDPNKPEVKTGEVVFTSYILDGVTNAADRPVTFALNGGPGAASVFLNLGAIGPKRIEFANRGDSPSDPPRLLDNPGTWLPFSDLVFIDPIGTGFSRSLVSPAETKKFFYSTTPDIEYLSRVIMTGLSKMAVSNREST